MARILFVGEDSTLLETRAFLLKDWETVTTSSAQARAYLDANPFEMILFCQSVAEDSARNLIQEAICFRPHPIILVLRFPGEELEEHLGVEVHTVDLFEDPGWLPKRVSALLSDRTVLS